MTEEYSKAQLDKAKAAIERLTPEEWIGIQEYILKLEKNWPEAPTSVNVKCIGPTGMPSQWTIRDFDDEMLQQRHEALLAYLDREGYLPERTYTPSHGSASAKSTASTNGDEPLIITTPGVTQDMLDSGNYKSFPVESIIHAVTVGKAVHHLVVKGGIWKTYGYKAWPEVIPADFKFDQYEVGKESPPPSSMQITYFDEVRKRVVAFLGVYEE